MFYNKNLVTHHYHISPFLRTFTFPLLKSPHPYPFLRYPNIPPFSERPIPPPFPKGGKGDYFCGQIGLLSVLFKPASRLRR